MSAPTRREFLHSIPLTAIGTLLASHGILDWHLGHSPMQELQGYAFCQGDTCLGISVGLSPEAALDLLQEYDYEEVPNPSSTIPLSILIPHDTPPLTPCLLLPRT